jgi:hypothetical protein
MSDCLMALVAAGAEVLDLQPGGVPKTGSTAPVARDVFLILSAAAVLALFLFLAVKVYFRGKTASADARGGGGQGGSRRRREHRPRNPTLAETGGLPPIRPGGPPGPPA